MVFGKVTSGIFSVGMVWEAYHKGEPMSLGVPGITLDVFCLLGGCFVGCFCCDFLFLKVFLLLFFVQMLSCVCFFRNKNRFL